MVGGEPDKHGVCEHCGGEVGEDGMAEGMADGGEVKISPNSEDKKGAMKSDLFAAAVKRSGR